VSASIIVRALASVSSYSAAGSESHTMPAPAWKVALPPCSTMVRIGMLKSIAPVAET